MSLHHSGAIGCTHDWKGVHKWVNTYLAFVRKKYHGHPLCVVMDIDDTVLVPPKTDAGKWKRVSGMKRLYNKMKSLGFHVFFITARPKYASNEAWTKEQLQEHGYDNYDGLFLMPEEHTRSPNFSAFKESVRSHLVRAGFHVALTLGDQWGDLALLPPYQQDPHHLHRLQTVMGPHSEKEFVIFVPPDTSWAAVKFPSQ